MNQSDQTERINSLESQLAHQDMTIQELSERLYSQQQQIDRLEAVVKTMSNRMKDLATGNTGALPSNERPPHY